ncbi:response regulator transcription factor [Domibacillus epiphyticus]|uniref:response regulator transcription factor n=1 Tax=Domibacillus epiphyticus TaxID=1714355 RepID=UPI001E4CB7BC|nr:LytTR family transcriptional regulator DNA-binding domain-containing protein [Domibacillus epiphyticus]
MKNIRKSEENKVLLPPFSLSVSDGEVAAIQCNHEFRNELMAILSGLSIVSEGALYINETKIAPGQKKMFQQIGYVYMQDELYTRLSVIEYLRFFQQLHDGKVNLNELTDSFGLMKKKNVRIEKLSYSEKVRVLTAKALVHDPDLLILEEPFQSIDLESKYIIQRAVESFASRGNVVLVLASYLENAMALTDQIYVLNESGLKQREIQLENEMEMEEEAIERKEDSVMFPNAIQMKIPSKLEDKLVLFHPDEIDYVESVEGSAQLYVQGEFFPCSLSLSDLEDKLRPYGFFRCHRSFIVHLPKVREVVTWTRNSYSLILTNSEKSSIPLSKGKLSELKEKLDI